MFPNAVGRLYFLREQEAAGILRTFTLVLSALAARHSDLEQYYTTMKDGTGQKGGAKGGIVPLRQSGPAHQELPAQGVDPWWTPF